MADIDAAVSQGPGLRWALFGPHMTFNLGGGAGGLGHFMDHLLGPVQTWWDDLGAPEVTPELRQRRSQASTPKPAAAASPSWRRRATRISRPC